MNEKEIHIEYDENGDEIPATPEEMKQEAVERLQLLRIYPETIRQFKDDGLVSISEPPMFAHYWADDDLQQVIKDFEQRYHGLVYYGIMTVYQELGVMYALFYVCNSKSEWQLDREDMDAHQQCCYVYVKDYPDNSEIGAIGYTFTNAGSLQRIW